MNVTLADVMRHVRNYFVEKKLQREWRTDGGVLYPADVIGPNRTIAVCGAGPAGVYVLDENGANPSLPDRQWTGVIAVLAPPEDFLRLCDDITAWSARHEVGVSSETIGDYSAHRGECWQQAFGASLAPYMRMYPEVTV